MTPSVAFAVWFIELLLIAALSARPRGARVGFILSLLLLPFPAFVDASPLVRSVLAVAALWCVVRSADFVAEAAPLRFGARLLHLFAIIDTRLVTGGVRHVAGAWVATLLFSAAVGLVAYFAVIGADSVAGAARLFLRWIAGAVLVLAAFELLTAGFRIVSGALGLSAPAVSDTPHRSRSIAEFWSSRWNLVVGKVLRDRVFKPLARRGTRFAVWATFAVSAVLHAYLMGVALGAVAALASGVFFLLQPLLLAAERKLDVRRWPDIARRVWTISTLALLSPLFLEPVLQVLVPTAG